MTSIGLNVDRSGRHDPSTIRGLGATWIRIVAMPDVDLTEYFRRCKAAGLQILLVLARESGGDYAGLAARYATLVDAVAVGNEPDAAPNSPSSWIMNQAEFVSLGKAVRGIFPHPSPVVAGGMVSGQPSWLSGLDLSWADALCVHPYGKTPSETWPHPGWGTGVMGPLLDGYAAFGKPLLVTEIGLGTHEVSEEFQAEYLKRSLDYLNKRPDIEVAFWFTLQDFPE